MTLLVDQMHAFASNNDIGAGEVFEEVVKTAYQDLIQNGDRVVDIGAHKGFHLFPMTECVGRSGKVYAFEPIPYLYGTLKKRIRKKGFRNIKLYRRALSNSKGISSFQHFKEFPAFSGINRRQTPFDDNEGGLEEIIVKTTCLDKVIPWYVKVSFMKLDIEGGELHALMGGEKLVARSRPVIIFEGGNNSSAKTYNYSKDDFFGFFEKHGFKLYTIAGTPFVRDTWENPERCWEFVALPEEKSQLIEAFPRYCKQAMMGLEKTP